MFLTILLAVFSIEVAIPSARSAPGMEGGGASDGEGLLGDLEVR